MLTKFYLSCFPAKEMQIEKCSNPFMLAFNVISPASTGSSLVIIYSGNEQATTSHTYKKRKHLEWSVFTITMNLGGGYDCSFKSYIKRRGGGNPLGNNVHPSLNAAVFHRNNVT